MFGGENHVMNDRHSDLDIIRKLGPGGHAFPTSPHSGHHELTHELQKYLHTLGPTPKRCLETFADLGLSDTEIARYFRIPDDVVTQLRDIWKIQSAI